MLEIVASIINTVVEVDLGSITMEQNLVDDIGLSSLDVINLVVLFEKEFDIEIPDRHIMKFVTIGDIAVYLQEKKVNR